MKSAQYTEFFLVCIFLYSDWIQENTGQKKLRIWHCSRSKKVSHIIFYKATKFRCLIPFTSWDIGPYVYCNCLFPRLWRHKLWNKSKLFYQAVLVDDKKVTKKCWTFTERKELFRWNKKHFSPFFTKLSASRNCFRPEIVPTSNLFFTEKTLISTKHWRKYIREMCLDSLLGSACVLPQTSLSQNKKSYKTKEMSFSQSKTRFWPALYGNIPPSWSNYNLIEKPSTLLF